MTKSKIFLYFCLSFIGGIFLNSSITTSQPVVLVFLILGLILISVFWQHKKAVVFGFCLLFLVLGIYQHQKAETRSKNHELIEYTQSEEDITLLGLVYSQPGTGEYTRPKRVISSSDCVYSINS